MARTTHCACTSVLVGKAATIDGSILIARTEDNSSACAPKRFTVMPARSKHETFVSANNGFTMKLEGARLRHTSTPEADPAEGNYEEAGINEAGVAMSATESTYANERALACDPLVEEGGLAEDALVSIVLPFIRTAREGVRRVGEIVAAHGSAESNSILFADADEAWYLELATGHHWAAQRIPDDAYAVCANRISIQEIDFGSDDFMTSEGIREFVDANRLNPCPGTFDFRRIFGTYTQQDVHYNAPRVWFGQRLFTPEAVQQPEDLDLPFIRRANRLIGVDDVAQLLSSHFEGTAFDPLGSDGDERSRTRYRAVSLSRTQEGHILQIRPGLPPERAHVHWVALATTAFSPFVPFFANASAAHPAWESVATRPDASSAYWLLRTLGMLAESRWPQTARDVDDWLKACRQKAHAFVADTDRACEGLEGKALTEVLTSANHAFMEEMLADARTLAQNLMMAAAEDSRLSFDMDANL
ncbi:C69 family dipeptidase [Arabiibacter massiliensis]|uniref:C69 family dipeptidase n=1 Tax=Arabiibacter massiliensis TaxID=1870985 RepID=UPI00155B29C2|nr:C69 family dipeptidase [Arabiibacter massiliensis]